MGLKNIYQITLKKIFIDYYLSYVFYGIVFNLKLNNFSLLIWYDTEFILVDIDRP